VKYKLHRSGKPREIHMSVNVLYKTSAKATGGRDGTAATLDGALDVKLATPKELGGGGGAGNNPEQLFAAGYAACFIGAMKFVASQGGPKVPADASVTSTVGIGPLGRRFRPRHRPRFPARPSNGRRRSAGRERTRCPTPTPPAAMWMSA
jgi:organic hydroperoxide reductase OsmC/OhrA